jgi:diguanylate cyclase (GGDEF)-like protein
MEPERADNLSETPPRRRPQRWVIALAAGMLAAATSLYLAMDDIAWGSSAAGHMNPVVLTALVAVAELCVVHVYLRRETHTYSLREIPFVVGLFMATPGSLLVAYVIGAVAVLVGRARQSGLKLFFNASLLVFEAVVGIATFQVLVGDAQLHSPRSWLAAATAALVLDALGGMLVTVVIALHGGGGEGSAVGWLMLTGAVAAVTNASFALVSVIALSYSPAAAVLLSCLGATLFLAYHSYASLRRHYSHLLLLRGYTESIGNAIAFDDVALAAVRKARELLEADHAELWFCPPDGSEQVLHIVLHGDDVKIERQQHDAGPTSLWSQFDPRASSVLVRRGAKDPRSRAWLANHACADLVAASLRTERGVMGAMLVGDRMGDVATFERDDCRLLENLADYTSIALLNGRLVDELQVVADTRRHEALHDSLTGLPNRRGFVERSGAVVAEGHGTYAVLLMDLDHFKDVNDTFGHPSGDRLLVEVAQRLREVTRAPASVARLGGDEFAIVITNVETVEAALTEAERLHAAVARPYEVSRISVQVDASIGVAVSPQHGRDVDTLLRCADIAMYAAKQQRSSCRVYDPMDDHHTPERLALATELKHAIESNAIALGYQPTKDLATGRVVGVEALARWEHPTRGVLPPPTYIAVAEQTGLIQQLTRYVLRTALEQRQSWAERGMDLRVSVNVSVNDLESPGFVSDTARLVRETNTPAGRLTLEITETQAMERPERIADVLEALRCCGVEIAIDDFGTGYSSLTSLRSLPLDEVKIDSSFIRDMTVNNDDDAIVRSMIELARRLNLRIVAEGVETCATEQTLRELGCNLFQGYLLSRALSPSDLERWLENHDQGRDAASPSRFFALTQAPR